MLAPMVRHGDCLQTWPSVRTRGARVIPERVISHRQRHLKLFIVDNEPTVRSELSDLCRKDCRLQVVGEAECGRAAMGGAQDLRPDVMLVDVRLPDMDGFELMQERDAAARPLFLMTSH